MTTLLQDMKFGWRMMAKSPVVTIVAVLSLALGIAANASVFSLVHSFFFEPLPYDRPDELVLVRTLIVGEDIEMAGGLSAPNFRDVEARSRGVRSATLYTTERANLTGLDVPEQLTVVVATPALFDVFGVQPAFGRGFRAEEGAAGAARVVVLEHDYWQRRFLGDPQIVGRAITLDGDPYTVIGVMSKEFDMIPANIHAIRPSDFSELQDDRASRSLLAFARLAEGVTPRLLQLELDAISESLAAEYPEANRDRTLRVQPIHEVFPGPTDALLLKILAAVTLFGLLIACANVANLLLARAEERQTEVALRTALGAGRARILRQMLTESVVMAATACAVGVTLAFWIVRWLRTAMPAEMPAVFRPELDATVLLTTLLVSIAAGVAFGLAPAIHAVSGTLRESLGNGARGGTAGRRTRRIRSVFVIGEVAVALALLSGSGLLIQAFGRLMNDDPGFSAEGLLTFQIAALEHEYPTDEELASYEQELVRALAAVQGVESVAVMSSLPRGRSNPRTDYMLDSRPISQASDRPTAGLQSVNPGYFATMAIDVRRGRSFTEADRRDGAPVAIISESVVTRDFSDTDPIGERITVQGISRTVVGVASDVMQDRIALAGQGSEQIYVPSAQIPRRNPSFALRTTGDPAAVAAEVRRAVWSVEADQPVADVQTMQAFIEDSLAGPRAISLFLMMMGGIALVLAAMGIYGVMAHSVTQRRREIGIRIALGAGRGSVVGMMTKSGLTLVGIGILGGLPLAFLMLRGTVVSLNLFEAELGFGYPVALAASLVGVAVLATVVPARRASGISPTSALRE